MQVSFFCTNSYLSGEAFRQHVWPTPPALYRSEVGLRSVQVTPITHRLICTNGMRAWRSEIRIRSGSFVTSIETSPAKVRANDCPRTASSTVPVPASPPNHSKAHLSPA